MQSSFPIENDYWTNDIDEAVEHLSSRSWSHSRVPHGRGKFGWGYKSARTSRLFVSKAQSKMAQVINAEVGPTLLLLHLPVDHSSEYRIGKKSVTTDHKTAILLPPNHSYTVHDTSGQTLSIGIEIESLLLEIEQLWPGRKGHAVLDATHLELSATKRRSIHELFSLIRLTPIDSSHDDTSAALRRLEQDFIHDLAAEIVLQSGVNPLSRRRRHRVEFLERWIDKHIDEHIDMSRLVDIAGVKSHALAKATSAARGMSPMELVLSRRLKTARRLLMQSDGLTVTQVALNSGFSHMGRFSGSYKQAYGESPSETLARNLQSS